MLDDIISSFEGCLSFSGINTEVYGVTYSDRQWGKLGIQSYLLRWDWAHLVSDERGIVAYCAVAANGKKTSRWVEADKSGEVIKVRAHASINRNEGGGCTTIRGGDSLIDVYDRSEEPLRNRDEVIGDFQFKYMRTRIHTTIGYLPATGVAERMDVCL